MQNNISNERKKQILYLVIITVLLVVTKINFAQLLKSQIYTDFL